MIQVFKPGQKVLGVDGTYDQTVYRFLRDLVDLASVKPVAVQTAAYSSRAGQLVPCDPSGGAFTVTLPSLTNLVGRFVIVKNDTTSTNTITIAVADSATETVDGATSITITTSRSTVAVMGLTATTAVAFYLGTDAGTLDGIDSTGFAILAGQSGGQTLNGGTDASDGLALDSTSHATKGFTIIDGCAYVDGANLRVGVNQNSPDTDFHIASTGSAVIRLETTDTTVDAEQEIGAIEWETQDATSAGVAAKIAGVAQNTSGTCSLAFSVGPGGSMVEAMRLEQTGELGIGTTDPDQLLHIASGTAATIRLETTDTTVASAQEVGVIEWETRDAGAAGVGARVVGVADGTAGEIALAFETGTGGSASERVRIESGGDVGIGTASPSRRLQVNDDAAADYVAYFFNDGNDAGRHVLITQGGADDGSGTTEYMRSLDGDGTFVGYIANISGTYQLVDSSDERQKSDIADTKVIGLDVINSLSMKEFRFTRHGPQGHLHPIGFTAQNCEQAFPEMVVEPDGPSGMKGVSRTALIPVLCKAIQELTARIEALEAGGL